MYVAAVFNYSDLGDLRGFPAKEHRMGEHEVSDEDAI